MKKKVLSLALALLMLVSLVPMSVMAEGAASGTYTDYNGTTYTLSNGVLTVSGEGLLGQGWNLELDATAVTELVIEEGITGIDLATFSDCTALTHVTLPDSMTNIGYGAFLRCSALTSIVIPDGVTEIDSNAFRDCTALADVTIGSGMTSVGSTAFENTAYYNNEANWENGVLYIDACLIDAKEDLSGDYRVKDGTRVIGAEAFYSCTTLTGVSLPDSVTNLNTWAFTCCSALTSVNIPNGVSEIGFLAFAGCDSLTDVYYSGTEDQWDAISIGEGNSGLTNATIHYGSAPAPTGAFTDVANTAYYAAPVAWAVEKNITGGYPDSTFRPMNICTRAQIVTFIWRANGSPEPSVAAQGFNDVAEGTYYYKAVLWASEKGITGGFNDGGFHPDELVTRAQAMTFLWRANGTPAVPEGTVNTFKDVTTSNYYYDAVLWAVASGITGGYDSTTFGSMDGCTRAQIVTFLYRDMA